jgi:hypothetical protein
LKKVPGRVGKIILDKFSSVLAKEISNILSLDATDKDNNDLDPEHISSLKYAPITSVDVERTFSSYNSILYFQHVVYTIFFRRPQKKTLIFGISSNFKYYLTELRTKHTLVAMVITTVCNDFIAHRLEGI